MKSISIQFHATTDELLNYILSISSELKLYITVMTYKPFNLNIIEGKELSINDISSEFKSGRISLILNIERPYLESTSPNRFLDENPGSIILDIGKMTESGLEESALSFMSDEDAKISIAKKVASKLKKITKAGVIAFSPTTGAEVKVRTHRYTEGAKLKYKEGIKILPIAGNNLFKLPD